MQQATLEQLNDIVEPGAASSWPPAWPVVIIAVISVSIVLFVAWWLWQRYQARKPQRIALAKLTQLQRPAASDITLLCKRVALVYFPRTDIAQLSGSDWLTFLNAPPSLTEQYQALLYQPASAELISQYQVVAINWIKQAQQQAKQQRRGRHV